MTVRTTSLVVEPGQSVRVYLGSRLLAITTRTGRGWGFYGADGHRHESAALDGVLAMLGAPPNHSRESRSTSR